MKTFKEYTEYMGGVRLGNYSRYHPMASLGDSPPKNFDRNYQSRGVGLHAGYGGNAGTNIHGRGHMNLKPQASLNAETNLQTNETKIHINVIQLNVSPKVQFVSYSYRCLNVVSTNRNTKLV